MSRLLVGVAVVGTAILFPGECGAAENAAAWRGVTRIRGAITIEYRTWIHEPTTTMSVREDAQVRFLLVLDRGDEVILPAGLPPELAAAARSAMAVSAIPRAQMIWRAESAAITGSIRLESNVVPYGSTTQEANFTGAPTQLRDFHLMLTPATGVWQIVSPGILREKYPVTIQHRGDDPRTDTEMRDAVQSVVFDGTVSGKLGAVSATLRDEGLIDRKPTRGYVKVAQLRLWPEADDVEVEVSIEGYAKWRPEGSIAKPATPGNRLVARATLVPKGGSVQDLPKVKGFRFALLDTSREPGVCLNWPLHAKDDDFDLRLASAPPFAGQLSRRDQTNEINQTLNDDRGRPYAESQIDSYDFGGRSSLEVLCTLEDGREIIGVMKGDGGGQDLVRLPKMNGPNWIAESWRKEKNVEGLAADHDDEKIDGQKDNGDGFTLYEEYRGWVVDGKRIEGNPERKDFFVLNLIGADGRPGIELFEALSKLRVHSKLRRSEMSQTMRLMNGNHRDAPHRVDQHGVWVKTFTRSTLGDNGADTPMTKSGVAGRPGITKGVGILARGDSESIFNQPFNLPAQDSIFAYDRAIAHELLHSVGVEHHGKGDYRQILGYVSPRNPANKLGRPYYGSSPDKPVGLLDEAGHDIATKDYEEYVKFRQFSDLAMLERELAEGQRYIERNGVGWNGIKTPEQYANMDIELLIIYCFMHLNGIVGAGHGEHAGDQDCVMRYSFAKFYEATGRRDTLYLVTPGTERIGMDICHAGTGTGINASSHKPQSRYGNAAAGEGDCFSQICPNDAIPPRKVK